MYVYMYIQIYLKKMHPENIFMMISQRFSWMICLAFEQQLHKTSDEMLF